MNVSISEILVVLVIALIVIKPEQMPDAAVMLGRFIRSIQQLFGKVKDEMNGMLDGGQKSGERNE